jgi:hypothetical protein
MEPKIMPRIDGFRIDFENGYAIEVIKSSAVSPNADITIFDRQGTRITGEWSELDELVSYDIEPYWIADAIFWAARQRKQ